MKLRPTAAWLALPLLVACSSAYYGAMERIGKEKRHILADRVEASRKEQGEAQEEFQSAYERFQSVTGYDGGDVEAVYRDLADALERSENKAQRVRDRIDSVETVATDLFAEWETEIGEIQNRDLARKSQASLRDTRARYEGLMAAMRRAESRMDPVLQAFRDQVLFLKHNLNARAIASLEGTVGSIEGDVKRLLDELGRSIREADAFLETLDAS
ncbi:MAG TPA: DUF2959 domain-containing protein [Myxococcota bacterium]|nr:DUF2959 domain-containing protein [Myxococcota bacterium]